MIPKQIYFIKPVGLDGPVKIGCSRWPKNRLNDLGSWSPFLLELVYAEEAEQRVERQLHACFADYHSHLEWFHPGERLLAALEKLKNGSTIAEAIDLNDAHGSIYVKHGKRNTNRYIPPKAAA